MPGLRRSSRNASRESAQDPTRYRAQKQATEPTTHDAQYPFEKNAACEPALNPRIAQLGDAVKRLCIWSLRLLFQMLRWCLKSLWYTSINIPFELFYLARVLIFWYLYPSLAPILTFLGTPFLRPRISLVTILIALFLTWSFQFGAQCTWSQGFPRTGSCWSRVGVAESWLIAGVKVWAWPILAVLDVIKSALEAAWISVVRTPELLNLGPSLSEERENDWLRFLIWDPAAITQGGQRMARALGMV